MKTIEERAKEWIDSLGAGLVHPYNRQAMIDAYIAGAKAQYEELTRWHDPKEVIYEPNHIVLTKWKYKDGSGEIISIGGFNGEEWDAHSIMYPELFEIIGWREIHK
ncbi:hypothetical protein [Alistipes putredinis]|uniref:hypothetical protein n=1 Tax=Alistipes putredinis TaxID=28117 RepID=UPI003AB14347